MSNLPPDTREEIVQVLKTLNDIIDNNELSLQTMETVFTFVSMLIYKKARVVEYMGHPLDPGTLFFSMVSSLTKIHRDFLQNDDE